MTSPKVDAVNDIVDQLAAVLKGQPFEIIGLALSKVVAALILSTGSPKEVRDLFITGLDGYMTLLAARNKKVQ